MMQTKFKMPQARLNHGGRKAGTHAKEARPFFVRKWNHVCLRSGLAVGPLSLLQNRNRRFIEALVAHLAKRYFLNLKDFANVGNHLHLQVRARRKEDLQNFLRVLAALIARHVTGARKGRPFGKFWDGLTYTRVLTTSMEDLRLRTYIRANQAETHGGAAAREDVFERFRNWCGSDSERLGAVGAHAR